MKLSFRSVALYSRSRVDKENFTYLDVSFEEKSQYGSHEFN